MAVAPAIGFTLSFGGANANAGDAGLATASEIPREQMEDLQTSADSEGIPLREVVARFGGQNDFIELVESLRSRSDDILVRAEWKGGSGLIYLRPGADEVAVSVRANANVSATTVDQLGEKDQAGLMEEVALALERAGQEEFSVGYDFDTRALRVTVYEPIALGIESVASRALTVLPWEVI